MVFIANANNTLELVQTEPIYQGSALANNIAFIAPFSENSVVTIAFKLPNGIITEPKLMTLSSNMPENVAIGGKTANAWEVLVDSAITQYSGQLQVQFYIYSQTSGTTNSILASYTTSFEVEKGVSPILPTTPTQTIYQQILTALATVNGDYTDLEDKVDENYDELDEIMIKKQGGTKINSLSFLTSNNQWSPNPAGNFYHLSDEDDPIITVPTKYSFILRGYFVNDNNYIQMLYDIKGQIFTRKSTYTNGVKGWGDWRKISDSSTTYTKTEVDYIINSQNAKNGEGDNSVKIGNGTVSNGDNSLAIGNNTKTDHDNSLAVGDTTQAGENSIVGGKNSEAGDNALAVGIGVTAGDGCVAFGKYNDPADDVVLSIGGGTADTPKDIFRVYSTGEVRAGNTNSDSSILATKGYVDNGLSLKVDDSQIGAQVNNVLSSQANTNVKNLIVSGDIIQSGSTYETEVEVVKSKNDLIITRDGATTALPTGQFTGIQATKYDGTNDGQLVFDSNGVARVGDVGDTQPLATREETPTNGGYAKWNSEQSKFETVVPQSTIDDSDNLVKSSAIKTQLDNRYTKSEAQAEIKDEISTQLVAGDNITLSVADDKKVTVKSTATKLYKHDLQFTRTVNEVTTYFYGEVISKRDTAVTITNELNSLLAGYTGTNYYKTFIRIGFNLWANTTGNASEKTEAVLGMIGSYGGLFIFVATTTGTLKAYNCYSSGPLTLVNDTVTEV